MVWKGIFDFELYRLWVEISFRFSNFDDKLYLFDSYFPQNANIYTLLHGAGSVTSVIKKLRFFNFPFSLNWYSGEYGFYFENCFFIVSYSLSPISQSILNQYTLIGLPWNKSCFNDDFSLKPYLYLMRISHWYSKFSYQPICQNINTVFNFIKIFYIIEIILSLNFKLR